MKSLLAAVTDQPARVLCLHLLGLSNLLARWPVCLLGPLPLVTQSQFADSLVLAQSAPQQVSQSLV